MGKLYKYIITWLFIIAMVISFFAYGIEAVTASQLIVVWLPMLAIYHYCKSVKLVCIHILYATLELALCFMLYVTALSVNASSVLATHQVVVSGAALWSIVITLWWAGQSFASKNKKFIYNGQVFVFATCICAACSIAISYIAYMPDNWFENGVLQFLTSLVVYAMSALFVRSYATK